MRGEGRLGPSNHAGGPEHSKFDRKQYLLFPDLPKKPTRSPSSISDAPKTAGSRWNGRKGKRHLPQDVGIERAALEEDAGSLCMPARSFCRQHPFAGGLQPRRFAALSRRLGSKPICGTGRRGGRIRLRIAGSCVIWSVSATQHAGRIPALRCETSRCGADPNESLRL